MSMQKRDVLNVACCSGDLRRVRDVLALYNCSRFLDSDSGYFLLCITLKKSIFSLMKFRDLPIIHGVYYEQFASKFLAISKLLLQYGVRVNEENIDSFETALHLAIETRDFEIVEMLLSRGALINAKNSDLDTPLHTAVQKNEPNIVQLLLKNGADPEMVNEEGMKPVHLIVKYCDECMINLFVENKIALDFNVPLVGHIARAPIQNNSLEMVKFILEHRDNIDQLDADGFALLHVAAMNNNKKIVQLLLDKGSNVNVPSETGKPPIYLAVEKNCIGIVQLLLNYNADISSIIESVPVMRAVVNQNHKDMVRLLLSNGCCPNKGHLLHSAVYIESCEMIELLLEHGAEINARDSYGKTPLHIAAKGINEKVALLLLQKGCDANPTTPNGSTPLHLTTEDPHGKSRAALIKCLLENGANPKTKNKYGLMPLNYAVKNRNLPEVAALLDKNPDHDDKDIKSAFCLSFDENHLHEDNFDYFEDEPEDCRVKTFVAKLFVDRGFTICTEDFRDVQIPKRLYSCLTSQATSEEYKTMVQGLLNKKETHDLEESVKFCLEFKVLRGAAEQGFIDIVNNLLTPYVNINAPLKYGRTLLHVASENGQVSIVDELLKRGADVNALDIYKMSALHLSVSGGHLNAAKRLLSNKADFEVCDGNGQTPLHLAVEKSDYQCIRLLLDVGANVNAVDLKGDSPLHVSVDSEKIGITKMLLDSGAFINASDSFHIRPIFKKLQNRFMLDTQLVDLLFNYGAQMVDLDPTTFVDQNLSVQFKIKSIVANVENFAFRFCPTMAGFKIKCQVEIEKMKLMKFDETNISVHDFLIKSERQIARYLMNENIVQFLNLMDLQETFPIFGSKLNVCVEKGKMRNNLFRLSHHWFQVVLNIQLPIIVIDEIFSYLDNLDLRRFIIASSIDSEDKSLLNVHSV